MSELASKAIEVAISQIGQEEKPRGSNWGIPVKDYLAVVGITFPASWCMAFVQWCYKEAAMQLHLPFVGLYKSGGVLNVWNHTPKEQRFTTPEKGDIFIQDHGHGLGHTGIVEAVAGEYIDTIEGNSNDTGSREGYEVVRKRRLISSCIGFIRI